MMATLLFLALFLLGLLLALRPLLGPKEPFPEPPRREELLRELEVLKEEVEALEGEEKKRALARMVEAERLLEGYRPPAPRPRGPWPWSWGPWSSSGWAFGATPCPACPGRPP